MRSFFAIRVGRMPRYLARSADGERLFFTADSLAALRFATRRQAGDYCRRHLSGDLAVEEVELPEPPPAPPPPEDDEDLEDPDGPLFPGALPADEFGPSYRMTEEELLAGLDRLVPWDASC